MPDNVPGYPTGEYLRAFAALLAMPKNDLGALLSSSMASRPPASRMDAGVGEVPVSSARLLIDVLAPLPRALSLALMLVEFGLPTLFRTGFRLGLMLFRSCLVGVSPTRICTSDTESVVLSALFGGLSGGAEKARLTVVGDRMSERAQARRQTLFDQTADELGVVMRVVWRGRALGSVGGCCCA